MSIFGVGFGSVRGRGIRLTLLGLLLGALVPALAEPAQPGSGRQASPLKLDVFTGGETAYRVNSTLIYGKTESILVDAQFHQSDAARLADRVAATHTRLLAVFITHPDLDHYLGLELLHQRFPQARLYMAPRALDVFRRTVDESLAYARQKAPDEVPQRVPTPEELPSSRLSVDGQPVLIVPDRQGDVAAEPSNSFVVVPSLGAVVLGDLAFHGVHPWLEGSTAKSREEWRAALDLVRALQPRWVVAGHGLGQPEHGLASVTFTDRYLADFESLVAASSGQESFVSTMKGKYPQLEQPRFLELAAHSVFAKPAGNLPPEDGTSIAEARKAIEDGNAAWGRARVAIDQEAFDRALAQSFYVKLPDRRLTRTEFIERITHYPYGRVTRFDPTVLTVQREGDTWVAIIMEKLEYDQPVPEGGTTKGYTLAVSRDGWKKVGADWKILFSELVSAEMWRGGSPPPMGFW